MDEADRTRNVNAVYNPHGRPAGLLPTIYGFNDGGPPGFLTGVLLAEDGECLGTHCCSAECFMWSDLGIIEGTAPRRHERFRKHYPDGYRMVFVSFRDVPAHPQLSRVLRERKAAEQSAEAQIDAATIRGQVISHCRSRT